jgi:hypothetical protein
MRWGTALPATMRGAPTVRGMTGRAETTTVGMPLRSISFAIVAPQRLHVPQVAVSNTACTSAACSAAAISCPKRRARSIGATLPTVTKTSG